ncbi:MAG: hypothetical protein R3E54_10455 [Halioglobus sp.]
MELYQRRIHAIDHDAVSRVVVVADIVVAVSGIPVERVGVLPADQIIRAGAAVQVIIALGRRACRFPAAMDMVTPGATLDVIVSGKAMDLIVSAETIEVIVVGGGFNALAA